MVGFPARPRLLVVTVVCAALVALTAACSTAADDAAPPPPDTQATARAGALPPTQVSTDRRALADGYLTLTAFSTRR